ncbi:glycine cleavage system protein R [Agarivorans sp. TSD2052]|uniref:glycine cleavage system protein R n=1 Tax=Agarivorans sp. TSD2052 TaxID=2937286 RepID=UPI00200EA5D8|nr:ACT domain-containing protein [Agarivorans sp. TSD2052]UPW19982.1 glycine cleavage system protein R [Agarivorans sp. TSD2052]
MKQLVISVLGKDRPGIVDQLSSLVVKHHGSWLASSLTELAGQFAGILHIEVAEENVAALSEELLNQPQLLINIAEGSDSDNTADEQVMITVTANDRVGIVQEVTQVLNSLGISLSEINTHVGSAPNWGGLIFTAQLLVPCASDDQRNLIQDSLESLADDLMVDFSDE